MARNKTTAPAERLGLPADYAEFLEALKDRVRQTQTKAMLSVNRELITAEYTLRDIAKPIGVAQWQAKLVHALPATLQASLPSIEQIDAELELREEQSRDTTALAPPAKKATRQTRATKGRSK